MTFTGLLVADLLGSPSDLAALSSLLSIAKDLTITAGLLFVLYGGSKRIWVWGHHYLEQQAEIVRLRTSEDWWKQYALSLLDASSRAVDLAERRRRT